MPGTKDLLIMALVVVAVVRIAHSNADLYKLLYGVA